MSLFQHFAKWALRALVLWLAFEACVDAYAWGTQRYAQWNEVRGHEAVRTRLDRQIAAATAALNATREAATPREVWTLPTNADEDAATVSARLLAAAATTYGAQSMESTAETSAGDRVLVRMRWREHSQTSPQVLASLARRYPDLRVTHLSMTRSNDTIASDVTLSLAVQPSREASP